MAKSAAAKTASAKTGKSLVRYGVVGAGWISQATFMPGVKHTGNSVMTALVTGDAKKAKALGKMYGIEYCYDYEDYHAFLNAGQVDALYIALPNRMHKDYTIPALEKGIHVLLEKPMAVSSEECQAITDAAKRGKAKLMIAYRLHCEAATLTAIERVRKGEIGEPRFFSATMGQKVESKNHRASNGFWAGPVSDMGPYPINAVRNLFESEPIEVSAVGVKTPGANFNFHDTVAVTLRFPQEKLAQFTVSYASTETNSYQIVGSEGALEVTPGFTWQKPIEHRLNKNGKLSVRSFEPTDHFGGETKYFSNCVLKGEYPEPDGQEGLADVRVIEAIERALNTGQPQKLEPFKRKLRPQMSQLVRLSPIKEPKLVNAAKPAG